MSYDWKWSIGEAYYKSARRPKMTEIKIKEEDTQQNAIMQSLDEENGTEFRNINRREILDDKMADREMIGQRGSNPFLQSSYVNDVVVRDMFLKPINTSQEKEIKETPKSQE
jgi:hypothetical protein